VFIYEVFVFVDVIGNFFFTLVTCCRVQLKCYFMCSLNYSFIERVYSYFVQEILSCVLRHYFFLKILLHEWHKKVCDTCWCVLLDCVCLEIVSYISDMGSWYLPMCTVWMCFLRMCVFENFLLHQWHGKLVFGYVQFVDVFFEIVRVWKIFATLMTWKVGTVYVEFVDVFFEIVCVWKIFATLVTHNT